MVPPYTREHYWLSKGYERGDVAVEESAKVKECVNSKLYGLSTGPISFESNPYVGCLCYATAGAPAENSSLKKPGWGSLW